MIDAGLPQIISELFVRKWGIKGKILIAIFLALIGIYLGWEEISKLPGLKTIIEITVRESIPKSDSNRFSILVAHLENDSNKENETLIIESLKEIEGIQVLSIDRTIETEGSVPEEKEIIGHEVSRKYLQETYS